MAAQSSDFGGHTHSLYVALCLLVLAHLIRRESCVYPQATQLFEHRHTLTHLLAGTYDATNKHYCPTLCGDGYVSGLPHYLMTKFGFPFGYHYPSTKVLLFLRYSKVSYQRLINKSLRLRLAVDTPPRAITIERWAEQAVHILHIGYATAVGAHPCVPLHPFGQQWLGFAFVFCPLQQF